MRQGEIAGRTVFSHEGYPRKGSILRDFQLCSGEGQPVLLSTYRGRSNLVLVFAGRSNLVAGTLSDLEAHQQEFAENETSILAIVPGPQLHASELKQSLHLNFQVLADVDGRVHRLTGASDQAGHSLPAVFVTDRFGEVFASYRTGEGESLPGAAELLSWVEFINRQCPECGPSEWPD